MKETVMIFNPPARDRLLKIEMALFPAKVRMLRFEAKDYEQTLGTLAGLGDVERAPADESPEPASKLSDTMLVFAFIDDRKLEQILGNLRKSGAGPLPYKAILTPTNQHWTPLQCFSEIRQEHEAMNESR